MKSCDDDADGDDDGFEKIPRVKLESKEFGVGNVEEDDHRQATGARGRNGRLQKNSFGKILEYGDVEQQVTSLAEQAEALLLCQTQCSEKSSNNHQQSKLLDWQEGVVFLDLGDLGDHLVPKAFAGEEDKLRI